ncbi:MAG: beta-galactosidase, partial [Candidatus Marsarchaeota archaeon]
MITSGEIHYARVPRALWEDRLLKLKRAGFNSVTSYFFWNYHEPQPGVFDFSGEKDVDAFMGLAAQLGLNVIARVGPYDCAEWDNGGHPDWLISDGFIGRSLDDSYFRYAERWLRVILGKLGKYDKSRGGNMIALQLENEYFWGDVPYHEALAKVAREAGITVDFYTNANRFARNTNFIDTLDLYPDPWMLEPVISAIKDISSTQPYLPPRIMEYEGGWFSTLLKPLPTERGPIPANWTRMLFATALAYGSDFISFYMFHGGTNFGPWAGRWMTTTYDYDAAIREWGELSDRYYKLKTLAQVAGALEGSELKSEEKEGNRLKVVRSKGDEEFSFYINNSDEEWRAENGSVRVPPRDVRVKAKGLKIGPVSLESNVDLLAFSQDYAIFFGDPGEEFWVRLSGGKVSSHYNCDADETEIRGRVNEVSGCTVSTPQGVKRVLVVERRLAERTWFLDYPVISDAYFVEKGDLSGLTIQSKGGEVNLYVPMEVGEYIPGIGMGKLRVRTEAKPAAVETKEISVAPLVEEIVWKGSEAASLEDAGVAKFAEEAHDFHVYEVNLPERARAGFAVSDFAWVSSERGEFSGFGYLEGEVSGKTKIYVHSTGHPNGPEASFMGFKTGLLSPVLLDKVGEEEGEVNEWEFGLVDLGARYQPGIATSHSYSKLINSEIQKMIPKEWSKKPPTLSTASPLVLLYAKGKFSSAGGHGTVEIKGLRHRVAAVFVNGELKWKGQGNYGKGEVDALIYSEFKEGQNEVVLGIPIYNARGELGLGPLKVTHAIWRAKVEGYKISSLREAAPTGQRDLEKKSPISIEGPSSVTVKFSVKRGSEISPLYARISGDVVCLISLNGHPIGRYYSDTSQDKFYMPEPFLREDENELKLKAIPTRGRSATIAVEFGAYYAASETEIKFQSNS